MSNDRLRPSASVWAIRARAYARVAIDLVALACMAVGAYNLLLAPILTTGPVLTELYHPLVPVDGPKEQVADVALICVGLMVVWLVD